MANYSSIIVTVLLGAFASTIPSAKAPDIVNGKVELDDKCV
ncbi:hypothetical protein [Clostridium saccharoperbutylacetonicum]|nr:hypothetical protein [Clostridium saccharoperbutylacetonicum]